MEGTCTGIWRLCTTWDLDPALDMGLDEVLALQSETAAPVLRLYTWRPAALSLGYFQRLVDVPAAREAVALVRRVTGGGAIHHAGELTFSIGAPLAHPLFRGSVADSYVRVHAVLARALATFGVEAELRGARSLASDRPGTGMCFHASSAVDLVWDGRKGVGSAQRRKGTRVLHHGSIKLAPSALEPGVAALAGVDPEVLGAALVHAFAQELGIGFEERAPDAAELATGQRLGERYADVAFVGRR